jgi:hypothetical protein
MNISKALFFIESGIGSFGCKCPLQSLRIVAQKITAAVVPYDLEVAMVWAHPAIPDLDHLDTATVQRKAARGLFAAIASVAFNTHAARHQDEASRLGRLAAARDVPGSMLPITSPPIPAASIPFL